MTFTVATFKFNDRDVDQYRVDFRPLGSGRYRIDIMQNGITRTVKHMTGRQVVSIFHAKSLIQNLKNDDHEKTEAE